MTTNAFGIGSSIPVLRMLDEARAREFYLDYLGYKIEWEHRFTPTDLNSPLYQQIRLGDSVLHLNGHAENDAPVTEVRIPVGDVDALCKHLRDKAAASGLEPPEIVDPRDEGVNTDLNLRDPLWKLAHFLAEKMTPSAAELQILKKQVFYAKMSCVDALDLRKIHDT